MKQTEIKLSWRTLLLLAVFVALTAWVFSRFTDLRHLGTTLSQGLWVWIGVAVGLHVLYFVMSAKLYQIGLATVEVESDTWHLLPVLFSALFANVMIPSGGTAGAAIFVGDAVRRGQSGARTAVGTLLVLLADLSTLTPFIIYSIIFLHLQNKLYSYDIVLILFFVIFILIMIAGLFLAHLKPEWLHRVLDWLHRAVNRVGSWVKHPDLLSEDWPEKNAHDLASAAGAITTHPGKLAYALSWATLMHVVNLAGLYAFFLAFQQKVELGTLISGFTLGIVFFVISVVPQGVAAVEGIMSLVFTSMGVSPEKTAAIVLAFRGVNFYLPLIFGFFLLRYISTLTREASEARNNKKLEQKVPSEP